MKLTGVFVPEPEGGYSCFVEGIPVAMCAVCEIPQTRTVPENLHPAMTKILSFVLCPFICGGSFLRAQFRSDGATASFKGSLPPKPTADISAEQQTALELELADVSK